MMKNIHPVSQKKPLTTFGGGLSSFLNVYLQTLKFLGLFDHLYNKEPGTGYL